MCALKVSDERFINAHVAGVSANVIKRCVTISATGQQATAVTDKNNRFPSFCEVALEIRNHKGLLLECDDTGCISIPPYLKQRTGVYHQT